MPKFKCAWCKQIKDERPIDMEEYGLEPVCLPCMQVIEERIHGGCEEAPPEDDNGS